MIISLENFIMVHMYFRMIK